MEVLWGAAGAIAQKLAPRERAGTGGSSCGGGVEAMLGSPCSQEGFLTQSSTCKLQQETPQLFLHYLLMLLLSSLLGTLFFFSVLPCLWTAVFQIRSCTGCLAKFHALHSVAPSHVHRVCLGHSSRSAALGEGFAVLVMKYKNMNSVIIDILGA